MKKMFANIMMSKKCDGFDVEVHLANGSKATFFFANVEKTEEWLESRKAKYDVFANWLF